MFDRIGGAVLMLALLVPGGLTRFRIQKLLFLADAAAFRARGRTVTGAGYGMYYHGPYSPEVADAVRELELRGLLARCLQVRPASGEARPVYLADPGHPEFGRLLAALGDGAEHVAAAAREYGKLSEEELLEAASRVPEARRARLGQGILPIQVVN